MLPARLLRLVAIQQQLQQLLPCAAGAATATAAAAAASASRSPPIASQWPSQQQRAASHSSAAASHDPPQHDPQQQAWLPERALPPSGSYGLMITIRAHDLLFVKLASSAIRDLVMVNIAPKSRDVLPELWRNEGAGVPWVNLAMPVGDRSIPTRRTHFTVISGPHVHKTAREQFARTTHTRVIQVATNNLAELDWLLHSIKMYKFVGVELSMRISSSSYLLPTSTQQQDAAQQPLLAGHKQRFAHLFGAAAPSSEASPAAAGSSTNYAALQQSLQGLRADVHQGLLQQRAQLAASMPYARWQETDEGQQAARGAASVAASKPPTQQLQDAVAQQLQGSSMLAGGSSSSGGAGGSREQALLHAVDKLLGGLDTKQLDRHKFLPFLMAFYRPGQHQTPAAEWMQAVVAAGKRRQAELQDASQQQAVLTSYRQYAEASRAMLLLLLQQWYAAADAESRRQLVLPGAGQVDAMKPAAK